MPSALHLCAGMATSHQRKPLVAKRGRRRLQRIGIGLIAAGLITTLLSTVATAGDKQPASRFTVDAALRPVATSVDGRYALGAAARLTSRPLSADGRYALVVLNAPRGGCESVADPLFSNGFE